MEGNMKQPTNLKEAVSDLKKYAEHYFGIFGQRYNFEIHGACFPDEEYESDLCLVINDYLTITPFDTTEEHPSIPEPITVKAIHYRIEKTVFVHGSRWEPDSEDIVEIKTDKPLRSPTQAIEKVIHCIVDEELEAIGTSLEEQSMYTEEELFHKQYALEEELKRNNQGNET